MGSSDPIFFGLKRTSSLRILCIFVKILNDMMAPFNLQQWIDDNRDILKPPVGNKNLYKEAGDFIVMVVGGPNARKDYHYNESEELFYQIEGEICVRIQENGKPRDIIIKEGEMFLLPANTPHSPMRGPNTVGLVIEKVRKGTDLMDGLMWFCDKCNHKLKEYRFPLSNIEEDFLSRFKEFYGSEEMRTCASCGHVMEADERFV
jgi:3-hydroxyanthranilate 3,4-dioxygenase